MWSYVRTCIWCLEPSLKWSVNSMSLLAWWFNYYCDCFSLPAPSSQFSVFSFYPAQFGNTDDCRCLFSYLQGNATRTGEEKWNLGSQGIVFYDESKPAIQNKLLHQSILVFFFFYKKYFQVSVHLFISYTNKFIHYLPAMRGKVSLGLTRW